MSQPCKVPCPGCPFARTTPSGELGGSSPLVYIGQAAGPFALPCHHTPEYSADPAKTLEQAPCVGAAIYRANTGVADKLPDRLLKLPANTEIVFATPEEFLAYHAGWPLEAANEYLKMMPVQFLTVLQMRRASNAVFTFSK